MTSSTPNTKTSLPSNERPLPSPGQQFVVMVERRPRARFDYYDDARLFIKAKRSQEGWRDYQYHIADAHWAVRREF